MYKFRKEVIVLEDLRRKLYNSDKIHNFRELVKRYETLYSDKLAFTYKLDSKSKEYINKTYSDFVYDIKTLGTSLLSLGLSKKRVAIISPNRYEWCVSYLAITTSDIIVVPLDRSLPSNEIESLIIRSEAEAVIFDKEYRDTFIKLKKEGKSNLNYYICMDNTPNSAFLYYSELLKDGKNKLENGDTHYNEVEIDNTKMSIMLFTSGTTAISKAVSLSQANICADIYALSQMTDIKKDDIFLSF